MALSYSNLYRNEVVNCAPYVGYLIRGEALDWEQHLEDREDWLDKSWKVFKENITK